MSKSYDLNELKGIRGWLYVVAIGVIAGPVYALNNFLEYPAVITGENFPFFNIGVKLMVWGEALFFAVMIVVSTYAAFLFFSKRREFPNWLIGIFLISITYSIVDAILLKLVAPEEDMYNMIVAIFRQMIPAAIWISYLLKSERVRLTFTN